LAESGAEYDAVGLEFYYTSRDMLETERVLDLYKEFGHPLYITESEVPGTSDPARPANAPPWFMPAPPSWHGTAWTETVQADWAEQFYTLAYSKPWVEMAGWWSLSDFRSSFAQGGFLREDNTPKEIFHRLLALRQRWAEKA
jgi:endo-1,4-beta-xylanase